MDPLANLNDIAEPGAVSIWPLAVGWWLAIAIILFILVMVGLTIAKRAKKNASRKLAIQELSSQYESNSLTLASANILLKRACLSYCGRQTVASLHGQAWLTLLYTALKSTSRNDELKGKLSIFEQSLYQKEPNIDPQTLFNIALCWLKQADFNRISNVTNEANHV